MQLSKIIKHIFLLFLLSSNYSYATDRPSFDCTLANTDIEKLICTSKKNVAIDIRALDVIISKVYSQIRRSNKNIIISQKQWLKERNKCALPNDTQALYCLLESYNNRLSILLSSETQVDIISDNNICEVLESNQCDKIKIHSIEIDKDVAYFFSDNVKSYLITKSKDGDVNWKASWIGPSLHSIDDTKSPVWGKITNSTLEYIILPGRYRSGCPDCGTQDILFIKSNEAWKPINLSRFNHKLRLFTDLTDETYMYINSTTGEVTVKAAFSNHRQAQVEDLSYLTAKGKLSDNRFVPETFKVRIW